MLIIKNVFSNIEKEIKVKKDFNYDDLKNLILYIKKLNYRFKINYYNLSMFFIKALRFCNIEDKKCLNSCYKLFLTSSKSEYDINDLLKVFN